MRRSLLGLAAAGAIAFLARRARVLVPSGAVAAVPVGAAVFAGTGLRGSGIMLAYVASSALLGRLPTQEATTQQRGNERDAVQVLANGGLPAALALAMVLPGPSRQGDLWVAFCGAVAAATADTWATELGVRAGQQPRSVLSGQPVARGASGGVTLAGLAASLAGAGVISALAHVRAGGGLVWRSDKTTTMAILLGGVAGSLVDSALGASLQQVRYCDRCRLETETVVHHCGLSTRRLRGQRWCNNDVVNTLAVASGAVTAAIAYRIAGAGRSGLPAVVSWAARAQMPPRRDCRV